jgi:hypothetical protein
MTLGKLSIVVGLIVAFKAGQANAALIAFDDFNYTAVGDDLNGQSGGGSFGFSGPWTGNTTFNIGNGSLTSPTGQPIGTANSMSGVVVGENRDIGRTLSTPLGAQDTTVYFSFLMRPNGTLHQGFANGWFGFVLRGGAPVVVGMGSFTDQYGVEVAGTFDLSSKTAVVGTADFFVLRVDFTEGLDSARLFINPPVGNEPATASAEVLSNNIVSVTSIDLSGPGAFSFDTLSIGTTWADVAPVPEPSGVVIFGSFIVIAAGFLWRGNRELTRPAVVVQ